MRHHAATHATTSRAATAPDVDAAVEAGPEASLDDLLAEAHQRYGNAAVAHLLASGGARALAGPGGPLPHRELLEARFGVDLGHVRAHTDPASQADVRATGAEALARGADVAFATATPSVETAAHEVAHVLQQGGGGGAPAGRAALEGEADAIAAQVAHGDGPVDVAALSTGGDQLLGKGLAEQVQALLDDAGDGDALATWDRAGATIELGETTRGRDPHEAYATWRQDQPFEQRDTVDGALAEIDDALATLDRANRRLARATQAKAALPAIHTDEPDAVVALQHRMLDGAVAKAQAEVEAAAGHAQALVARGVTLPPAVGQAPWRETSQLRTRERLELAEDRLTLLIDQSHEGLLASGVDSATAGLKLGTGVTLELARGRRRAGYAADPEGGRRGGPDAEPEVTDGVDVEGKVGVVLDDATTGVRGELGGGGRWGGGGREASLRPGVDGAYTIAVQRVGVAAPPLFDVTITFALGGRLGVGASGGGRGEVGASGEVSAGARLAQRRRLTAAELGGYAAALDRVEAGEAPGIAAFELDLLRARLAPAGGAALAERAQALLADPASVATMAPHEAVSLTTTLGLEAGVEGDRGAAGAAATAALALTRTVSIERLAGAPRDGGGTTQPVRLTVGFAEDGKLHGEAKGRYVGGEVDVERGDGLAQRFELDAADPAYPAVFAALTGARSRAELTAIAARPEHAAYLARSERGRREALATGMSFGGGVALTVGRSADFAEEQSLTYAAGAVSGVEGRVEGGSGYRAGLEVAGITIADQRHRDHAVAGYGADGPTLEIGEDTEARSALGWDGRASLRDALASEHPIEALLLARTANQHGVALEPADVARLIQRASDRRAWAAAVYPVDPQLAPAWETLRAALVAPTVDPDFPGEPAVARQAARARAVAVFMMTSRGQGYDVMRRVLDGDGAPAIGTAVEWPGALGMAKADYERACAQFEEDGPAGASAPALRTLLERVLYRVEGTHFETPRAKVSLIESIQTMLTALGARATGPEQRVDVLIATLTAAKQEEARTLTTARDLAGTWGNDDLATYDDATADLEDLDTLWIPRILELRELWTTTYGERDCPVSTGPGAPRNLALEPDAAARERLYDARSRRGVLPDYRYDLHAQLRRQRADRY